MDTNQRVGSHGLSQSKRTIQLLHYPYPRVIDQSEHAIFQTNHISGAGGGVVGVCFDSPYTIDASLINCTQILS